MQLSIVIPVYQSEACLEPLVARIQQVLLPAGISFEIILVNDGSRDGSWRVIEALCARHAHVVGVRHRRNFGQDNAIMTGFRLARGEFVATMDDDLQHDPGDLPRLMAALRESDAEVVFGTTGTRQDPWWKKLGRKLNEKTLEWLLDKPRGFEFTSYRMLRGEVVRDIAFYDGAFPYIDALLVQVSTRFIQIPITLSPRYAGVSNYTLFNSLQMWLKLVVSFSIKPLRVVTFVGMAAFLAGAVSATVVVATKLFWPEDFGPNDAGWASLMVVLLIMNGLQMCFIGILGEYVGRSYVLNSRRPQSVVAKVLNRTEVDP
ncbi:MAG: glycosyltransferase family 2 protein [Magnetococcales bacterium]|nr:glycosyltransferase family 2 protein [Magnetococcales bacterium]